MDRYYTQYDITIRDSIAATLLLWNTSESYMGADNDFLFVQFLLIDIFGGDALIDGNLDAQKVKFVKEVFENRVKFDKTRSSKLNGFMQTIREQFIIKKRNNWFDELIC